MIKVESETICLWETLPVLNLKLSMELKEKDVHIIIWAAPMTGVMADFLNRPATSSCFFFGKGYSVFVPFHGHIGIFFLCVKTRMKYWSKTQRAQRKHPLETWW